MTARCYCGYRQDVTSDVRDTIEAALVVHGPRYCFTVLRNAVTPHPSPKGAMFRRVAP